MRALLQHLSRMGCGNSAELQIVRFLKCVDRLHRWQVEDAVRRARVAPSFSKCRLNTLNGARPIRVIQRAIQPCKGLIYLIGPGRMGMVNVSFQPAFNVGPVTEIFPGSNNAPTLARNYDVLKDGEHVIRPLLSVKREMGKAPPPESKWC